MAVDVRTQMIKDSMQSSYFRKDLTTKSRNSEDNGHISS